MHIMKPSTWGRWLGHLFQKQIRTPKRGPRVRLGLEALEDRLAPATFTWTGQGIDANWGTKENWQGNVAPTGVPGSLEDLVFPSGPSKLSTTNNIPLVNGAPPTFNSITFSGSGYALAGNKITLG